MANINVVVELMTNVEIKQAVTWYVAGYDLTTIAQHFGLTRDGLAKVINNQEH
jgi:hypothetical protein